MGILENLGASGYQGGKAGVHLSASHRRDLEDMLKEIVKYGEQHRRHIIRSTTVPEITAKASAWLKLLQDLK